MHVGSLSPLKDFAYNLIDGTIRKHACLREITITLPWITRKSSVQCFGFVAGAEQRPCVLKKEKEEAHVSRVSQRRVLISLCDILVSKSPSF